jgi:hypothetical protein
MTVPLIGKSESLSSCQNALLISMWQQKVCYQLLKVCTTMNCMGYNLTRAFYLFCRNFSTVC